MIVRRHIVRGANCILISVDLPLLLQEHSGAYCRAAGIDCYQEGRSRHTPHMSIEEFADIARQAFGKTFQIALGGAGNPNKHPDFEKMLKTCRFYRIVPNITTSGFKITDAEQHLIKDYCGAVAVSWYSRLDHGMESNRDTIKAVKQFVELGCITNIHFVVSQDTIDEDCSFAYKFLFSYCTGILSSCRTKGTHL